MDRLTGALSVMVVVWVIAGVVGATLGYVVNKLRRWMRNV